MILTFIRLYFASKELFAQSKCKHESYRENMACHAVCSSCGKDLGFIAGWREVNPGGEYHR